MKRKVLIAGILPMIFFLVFSAGKTVQYFMDSNDKWRAWLALGGFLIFFSLTIWFMRLLSRK